MEPKPITQPTRVMPYAVPAEQQGWRGLGLEGLSAHRKSYTLLWDDQVLVTDEVTGQTWSWGRSNYVRLSPDEPAHGPFPPRLQRLPADFLRLLPGSRRASIVTFARSRWSSAYRGVRAPRTGLARP